MNEPSVLDKARPYMATVLFIVLLAVLFYTRWIVLTAVIGIGLGVLISPWIDFMQKRWRFPRPVGVLLLVVMVFAILFLIGSSMYSLVSKQFADLLDRWPQILASLERLVRDMLDKNPWVQRQFENLSIAETATKGFQNVVGYFQTGITTVVGASFALVVAIYTAIGIEGYFEGFVHAFPVDQRNKVRTLAQKCAHVIRRWFGAQLLNTSIVGALTALGLWIVGVEYWAVFGLSTMVLNLVPYIGVILVFGLLFLVTLATNPGHLPWVALVFIGVQQIESNITLPYIMRDRVKIPELPLLVAILIFGQWFGVIGFFIAPPVLAMGVVIYNELYLPYVV
jgi:predicted PurR-regulated permease PerM